MSAFEQQPGVPLSSVPPGVRQPQDRLQAEALLGQHDPVEVQLGEQTVTVLPLRQWRTSGIKALREGDFETWASKCLTPESWPVWQRIDPTLDEVETMFAAWSTATGQSPPESFASRR